ncbi:L-aspartate oxidase [Renibacterium salmoninarum ATCC 33209]|uniref:L-aspartate oxidase n=1 Tax=Renibacterium salmoninarum (strain ATCC 33209 / DSM 20767 / JCM 11484 / NBRC 15589 / NCIMB 2235) TaxID=288705 RepID=A9WNN6_RENSM|nr:L-aspartate oxidase [Renibacterium salmoninarum ATCC 33209]
MLKVAIVGSGLAGLTAAIGLAGRAEVTLLSKAELGESNSRYAQGGIAAVLSEQLRTPGDSVASHVSETMTAGAQLNYRDAVELLCEQAQHTIESLADNGPLG